MLIDTLAVLSVILLFSFLVETVVEALVGKPIDEFPNLKKYKPYILTYLAVAVGVYGAFVYQFDLMYILSLQFEPHPSIQMTTLGIILSGIAIGMGSSYLHDLFGKFILKKDAG